MLIRVYFLVTMMIACALTVSQYIGWRFPLVATSPRLNPGVAMGVVVATETAWLATNVVALVVARKTWANPSGFTLKLLACAIAISFPLQLFLGHLAIRELLDFMDAALPSE